MRMFEEGYVSLVAKEGGEYRIIISEYARALAAWKKGEAFLDTTDFYGGNRHVKLGVIESICRCTPEALASLRADEAEERKRSALSGD